MKERPKIKIELTASDKITETAGWLSIIAVWGLVIGNYASLPDIIPIHYNFAGEADGFGRKGFILPLPIIATVLFAGLTILNKFPHFFNYPANITKENAARQYTFATRLIRYLKLIIVVIFGLITLQTVQYANQQGAGPGAWFLPLTLGLIFAPLLYYIVKSMKAK